MTNNKLRSNLLELGSLKLFEGVAPELLGLITIEMKCSYQHGDIIQKRGDSSNDLIILTHGQACILVEDTFIVPRSAPAVIGEQAFIDKKPRSATIKAQGYVEAIVVPAKVVEELMKDHAFVCNLLLLFLLNCARRPKSVQFVTATNRDYLASSERTFLKRSLTVCWLQGWIMVVRVI